MELVKKEIDHEGNAAKLLAILKNHAPDGPSIAYVTRMHNIIPKLEREKALASMLIDGLRYGNWPWVLNKRAVYGGRGGMEEKEI